MLYLQSLPILLVLLLWATAVGRRVAAQLPAAVPAAAAFFLAPVLGLAVLILAATAYGWFLPFGRWVCSVGALALLAGAIALDKDRPALIRDWLLLCGFALVASVPIFSGAIRFDAFNSFNDAYTYLEHGQWLQAHAFAERARTTGYFPAETQVAMYQIAGHRMGGSFVLAFVQSFFHLEWSYYAYLPTVAFAFTVGCFALGATVVQSTGVSRNTGLALCLLPAMSFNGFLYGAQFGFFPQTFGLALASGLVFLLPTLLVQAGTAGHGQLARARELAPLAVCTAAFLYAYNDMFTPVALGGCIFLALACWNQRDAAPRMLGAALVVGIEVLLLVNVEGVRIVRNFSRTLIDTATGAVHFGWPVLWSPLQFVAFSFGMKAPYDNQVVTYDRILSTWVFPVVLVGLVVITARMLRRRPVNPILHFVLCVNAVFWVAFLKFRYLTPGQGEEVGDTFLQFKLAKWLSPFNLALAGSAAAWALLHAGRRAPWARAVFLVLLVAGMGTHLVSGANRYTRPFLDETLSTASGFSRLLELRSRLTQIPHDAVVYLQFDAGHFQLRQMVTYVLGDRKLAADYSDDGYIKHSLPADEVKMSPETADWLVRLNYRPDDGTDPLRRVGPFEILRAPFSYFIPGANIGGYATEKGVRGSWNWVPEELHASFTRVGATPRARVRFQYLLAGSTPRVLHVVVESAANARAAPVAAFDVAMTGGWGAYDSPIFDAGSQDLVVRLTADGAPVRLSANDSREAKFLVQNLTVQGGSDLPPGLAAAPAGPRSK